MDSTTATRLTTPISMPLSDDLRSFGRYRLLRELGNGGMSAVYLAYDPDERRPVALKVLADHLTHDRASSSRFLREAKIGQSLQFSHVVRTFAGERDPATDRHFLVLEYVDGPSCQFLLDRTGPLAVRDAARIALDMAMALEYLHNRRLVHRDIKPGNILLTTSGVAKLSDLGLVKHLDENSDLTAVHQGFGTSWYMPYEQMQNAKLVDGRSDIYALGATLYHLLTGVVPFSGNDHAEVAARKDRGEYAPARTLNPAVPPDLDGILARMLAREPRDRFPTATDLVVALERSQLADQLPSFVDIELAMQDPEARARLVSNNQPTSPDLRLPPPQPTGDSTVTAAADSSAGETWHLRFQDPQGQPFTRRATTNQILHGLREGYWPNGVEAARGSHKRFRPIEAYPEFRHLAPASVKPVAPVAPLPERILGMRQWKIMLSAAFGIGILAAASVAAFWRLLMHL
jgi:eukaryotic-like serine/threonine-protein kinase